jgi:transposase
MAEIIQTCRSSADWGMTKLPHNLPFTPSNLYSHFRPNSMGWTPPPLNGIEVPDWKC